MDDYQPQVRVQLSDDAKALGIGLLMATSLAVGISLGRRSAYRDIYSRGIPISFTVQPEKLKDGTK